MNILLPSPAPFDERFWSDVWPSFVSQRTLAPFADETLAFLDAFSKRVLLDATLRHEPAFAALAHWSRRAHLQTYRGHAGLAARGVVFHVAPANVDTLFAYSWFTSLLCGNLDVVRVSARSLPAIAPLLDVLRSLFAERAFAEIATRTLVVSYDRDDAVTARFSIGAHARLIWGGDETVRAIRAVSLPATAIEIAFADRFSLAAFSASYVEKASDSAAKQIAEEFTSDAFQFGQQACASPRLVVFVGDDAASDRAANRLWPLVAAVTRTGGFAGGPADGIVRLASAMALSTCAEGTRVAHRMPDGSPPLVLQTPVWRPEFRSLHGGAGVFIELRLRSLAELAPLLTPRDQTLVAAGFTRAEMNQLIATLPARALDRIVAPGHALDFEPAAWDGQNLFQSLTRQIAISASSS
jgi:hypothetical protein